MNRVSFNMLAAWLCGAYGVALLAGFLQQFAAVGWLPPASAWPLSDMPSALFLKLAIFLFMVISTYRSFKRQITPHRWKRRLYQTLGWGFLIAALVGVVSAHLAGQHGSVFEVILFDVIRLLAPLFILVLGYGLSREAARRKTRYFETLGISPG